MTCHCLTEIDELLAEHNGRLSLTISFGTGGAYPTIMTEKIDKKKRGQTPVILPTYCPFCGLKYEKKDAAA
jgi:hypothetical protein